MFTTAQNKLFPNDLAIGTDQQGLFIAEHNSLFFISSAALWAVYSSHSVLSINEQLKPLQNSGFLIQYVTNSVAI